MIVTVHCAILTQISIRLSPPFTYHLLCHLFFGIAIQNRVFFFNLPVDSAYTDADDLCFTANQ